MHLQTIWKLPIQLQKCIKMSALPRSVFTLILHTKFETGVLTIHSKKCKLK